VRDRIVAVLIEERQQMRVLNHDRCLIGIHIKLCLANHSDRKTHTPRDTNDTIIKVTNQGAFAFRQPVLEQRAV
jgi:hypothetical protein